MELMPIELQDPPTIQRHVLEIYARIPPYERRYLTWILSKPLMERLAGCELEDDEIPGSVLVGRPVRRDDANHGIGYEILVRQ